ncbi:hypothetical protein [Acinetobacter sp. MD2(2019)]|uniref:hypothetical protein n=1 Tax=Acinetobacter sp. MD2(2019) TaxID=2605273 RepID=UPI002D1F2393|nr:hypothetical protein [Acinetobacter sp. MD2(2019)]MEB3753466.1 hypothetical protein [Acinetobacter sp. MD2(2019)]
MQNNRPEVVTIDDTHFGSHIEHWSLLTEEPSQNVPTWLGLALDAPIMPMGLCTTEEEMANDAWLIQGPSNATIQFTQVVAVEDNRPKAVQIAFPSFENPYATTAQVERIIQNQSKTQAVLRLNVGQNATVYAFDTLYCVNHPHYEVQQNYQVHLNAWAYQLEIVNEHEHIVVDDPASIKHHRALNEILSEHNGIAPPNLQELIDAWQPKTEDDKAPVTVDFSQMVAYLYGENLGQEDEAWFQGKIVGKSSTQAMDSEYTLYDVTLLLEEHQEATLVRIATKDAVYKNFEIGQYIRGNLWIQATIYAKR